MRDLPTSQEHLIEQIVSFLIKIAKMQEFHNDGSVEHSLLNEMCVQSRNMLARIAIYHQETVINMVLNELDISKAKRN